MIPTAEQFLAAYISASVHGDCRADMKFRAYGPDGTRLYGPTEADVREQLVRAVFAAKGAC